MAQEQNTKFFKKLGLLFSSPNVIKQIGKSKLSFNLNQDKAKNNIYPSALYAPGTNKIYKGNPFSAQQSDLVRRLLYFDYEMMDKDSIPSSVLDIYTDDATQENDEGELLKIESDNEDIKTAIETLFFDILNIDFSINSWIRNLLKYGDFFLYLNIEEGSGVTDVIPLSPYNVERLEGEDEKDPQKVKFKLTGDQYQDVDLENYEIAHFRLLNDIAYLPYGKSVLETGRHVWKQLKMMEDAMLIYRVTRAPERRVFYVDVAGLKPDDVDMYMQKIINKIKHVPLVDEQTGELNLKYNVQAINDDFFFATRNGNETARVDTLGGGTAYDTEDIDYLQGKLFAAFKIPKSYLTYEEDLSGKCLHPDTKIPLLDGRVLTIKQIAELFDQNKEQDLWAYSFDFDTNSVIPGKIEIAEQTRKNAQLVRVWIDNDTYVDTTPDHHFILHDGTEIEAQNLQKGDSLRTIEKRYKKLKQNANEYEQIYQLNEKKWQWTHKMVDEYYNNKIENNGKDINGNFCRDEVIVVHHNNFNRYDNSPNNLKRMKLKEHFLLHSKNSYKGMNSPESRKKIRETQKTEKYRKGVSERRKEYFRTHPEAKYKLRDSWLNRTHEDRQRIVAKGSKQRSIKTSKLNKERKSYKNLIKGYKKKFPNGRPDLRSSNSVCWVERPSFEELYLYLLNNRTTINKFNDWYDGFGISQTMAREVINNAGYTSNELLNEHCGFRKGRPKDLRYEYIKNVSNGCKDIGDVFDKLGMKIKALKRNLNRHNILFNDFVENEIGLCYNHKVVKVEFLEERVDTYNMEVYDKNNNHNFLINNGLVIKNSSLAAEDVRFARTVKRIQKIVEAELIKMTMVHLYSIGFKGNDLINFDIKLTHPSTIHERQKLELMEQKISTINSATDYNIMSRTKAFTTVFGWSEDEIKENDTQLKKDAKFKFLLRQLEDEGRAETEEQQEDDEEYSFEKFEKPEEDSAFDTEEVSPDSEDSSEEEIPDAEGNKPEFNID